MMDVSTRYLGLSLRTPLVASSSPLSEDADRIRRLEDAGIAAAVLPSLFEEELSDGTHAARYLDLIREAKAAVAIPVIASLNGTTSGGWAHYARRIEEAGADAIELNLFYFPADLETPAEEQESAYVRIVETVRSAVDLPVAVKLGPFFTNLGHFARRVAAAGADGLVLFNRFFQPDIDLEEGRVFPHLMLSNQSDLRLPLRWIGLLHGRLDLDFAATGGIETGQDALKTIAVGASVAMVCSALLRRGLDHIQDMEEEMKTWMEVCELPSILSLRGRLSQEHCADPTAFERAQYVEALRNLPPGLQARP